MSLIPPSDHPLSPENPSNSTGLRSFSLKKEPVSSKTDVDSMSQEELLALRAKIDSKLTGIRLSDMNLEQETLIQYKQAKQLQLDANATGEGANAVPMNQRAQVQNSLASLLKDLAKMQMELHDSESLKRLRAAVIKVVRMQPKEFQDQFFDALDAEFQAAEAELNAV